jgi:hypothetical protein
MNENELFVRSGHNRLLLSLLSFEERRKQVHISCMYDNQIWVAPECREMGGHVCPYRGTLGRNVYFLK